MVKHVIAYLQTHWDREWYREYEIFRMRLLRVFDNVLDLLSRNKIPSFYFDGQVSAIMDYLEMRPENRELVETLSRHKKLFVGPFYCLVDEFLTDKTCFEKNLEIGIKYAQELGCEDFIGYLADTFGHSQNIPNILMDYGIDKCIVWRGCPSEIPAEFKWCGINTVNLVRGYFNDIFSMNADIETKAAAIKHNLDLVAEKSGDILIMPIGADHLGIEENIVSQISEINELLAEEYEILLGTPFDYFNAVEERFENYKWDNELRDNSNTFTLQGSYSSRLDLKRKNVETSYVLDLANRFVKQQKEQKYDNLIEYAYKMLLQNQAHDSICGCSTDDVHRENLIRYKKIQQVANGIIDELKFKNGFNENKIINLSDKPFSGVIEFETAADIKNCPKISSRKGFDPYLLADTQRIPVTEDYTEIKTYLTEIDNIGQDEIEFFVPRAEESDLRVSESFIENSNICLQIIDGKVLINGTKMKLVDYIDLGDSYNSAPEPKDKGDEFGILRTKVVMNNPLRAALRIDFEGKWDAVSLVVSLDKGAENLKFKFDWENSRRNHKLCVKFELKEPISEVFSEDMNELIKRNFDSKYDIRKHLPKERGCEAKTNTAPMQRGLLIDEEVNNIGIVTKGLTQYEIFKNNLIIPILRATGQISNPQNPARTTPAGPPIEAKDLQMLGHNSAEFYVFFGNQNAFKDTLNCVYNYVVV